MASNRELSSMLTAFLRAIETGNGLRPDSLLFQAGAALLVKDTEEKRDYLIQVDYRDDRESFSASKRWVVWATRPQADEDANGFARTQRAIGRVVTGITVTLEEGGASC